MKLRKERSENGSFFRKRKVSGKKKIVIGTAVVLTVSVAAGGVYWSISPERDRLHLKKQYRQQRRRQKSAPYQIQSWEREIWKQTLRFP